MRGGDWVIKKRKHLFGEIILVLNLETNYNEEAFKNVACILCLIMLKNHFFSSWELKALAFLSLNVFKLILLHVQNN